MRRLWMCIWAVLCTFAIQADEITTWQLCTNLQSLQEGEYAIVTGSECGEHSYKAFATYVEGNQYVDGYGTTTGTRFAFDANQIATNIPSGDFLTFYLQKVPNIVAYTLQCTSNSLYLGVQSTGLSWSGSNLTNKQYWMVVGDENPYLQWQENGNQKALYCYLNSTYYLFMASQANLGSNKPVSFVRKTQAYQRALGAVKMGTICVPYDVRAEDIQGCTCFEVLGTTGTGDNQVIHLGSVDSMKAGLPYIYVGDEDASQVKWTYSGQAVSNPGNKNGLYGTFDGISSSDNTLTGKYLLTVDSIGRVVFGLCADGSSLSANKAYLILDEVTQLSTAPSAPGRQLLSIGSPNMGPTTMLDECRRVECTQVQKVWVHGQWMICRGNKMYTLYGQPITGGQYE